MRRDGGRSLSREVERRRANKRQGRDQGRESKAQKMRQKQKRKKRPERQGFPRFPGFERSEKGRRAGKMTVEEITRERWGGGREVEKVRNHWGRRRKVT